MDPAAYRDFKTSRGFNYHYFFSAPRDASKPTLLFSHGFPSTSYDWHHQVDFFKKEGFGLVVPDMLGYGGTDKPPTVESYSMKRMARDIVDILDHERVERVIAIGHDWGSSLTSRLAYYHRERFLAFGMLAVAYSPPNPNVTYEGMLDMSKKNLGYTTFGYWEFFAEDGSDKVIEEHIDSFYSLLFPSDPEYWKIDMGGLGKARAWVHGNRKEGKTPNMTEEELKVHQKNLLQGGLAGPLCWYKAMVFGITPKDEQDVLPEKLPIEKPIFFGATLRDYICVAQTGKSITEKWCPKAKIVEFDTDHWVMFAEPDKLNTELLKWINNDVEGSAK